MKSVSKTNSLPRCGNSAAIAPRTRLATRNSKLKPYCGVLKLDYTPQCPGTTRSEPRAHIAIMGFDKLCHADSPENFTQIIMTDMKIRTPKRVSNKGRNGAGCNTHINAFIGFRTYYSRMLPNIHQRRLSSCLAKTWSTYIHKDFWTRYTGLYCAEPRSQCFVDWLTQRVVPPDLPLPDYFELVTSLGRGKKTSKKDATTPTAMGLDMLPWAEPGMPEFQDLDIDHLDDELLVPTANHSDFSITELLIGESTYPYLDDFAVSPTIGPMIFPPDSLRFGFGSSGHY
ncbi:hypothetical protein V1525DRAFT_227849 [Lipomyces kononenkoae]|uniref:Uncharacterized protein n=1 Tax=Lipomyces kononenkoae TaxID=34357 RepID=A0ACC3T8Q2_LIPKO